MNNYVLLILDSCRYDTMKSVWKNLINIPKIGFLNKAYSFSTWTLTSHITFVLGRLPWIETRTCPKLQKQKLTDLRTWFTRLNINNIEIFREDYNFKQALNDFGYQFKAYVSANPLGPESPFVNFVDSLECVGKFGNTLERIIRRLNFDGLSFIILNTCETHYPYYNGEYDNNLLEKYYIPGYRGQIRAAINNVKSSLPLFNKKLLNLFFQRQCLAIEYIDKIIPNLIDKFPSKTYLTITSDHGDCFGENGFIGHGEVAHIKALEVPFIEDRI